MRELPEPAQLGAGDTGVKVPGAALARGGLGQYFSCLSLWWGSLLCTVSAEFPSKMELQVPAWSQLDEATLMRSLTSLLHFPTPSAVFPVVSSQINHLHSNLGLRLCFWGNPTQDTTKKCDEVGGDGYSERLAVERTYGSLPGSFGHCRPIPSSSHNLRHGIGTR